MANRRIYNSPQIIGRFADWQNQESMSIPADMINVVTPEQNLPDTEYLRTGATQIVLGSGSDVSQSGLPVNQRAVFIENPHYLAAAANYDPNKKLPTWDQNMCNFAVDLWFLARNGNVFQVSNATEAYDSSYDWRPGWDYAPQQCEWMAQRWAYHMNQYGGEFYGDYGGTFDPTFATGNLLNIDTFIPGLTNYESALALMKQWESSETPYFKKKIWQWHSAIHKTYYRAHLTPEANLFVALIGFQLHNNAMKSGEVGGAQRKLCSFSLHRGMEFAGFTQFETNPVTGGTLTATAFPIYSPNFHINRTFTHWIYCATQWGWAEIIRNGFDLSTLDVEYDRYVYKGTRQGVRFGVRAGNSYQPGGAGISGESLGINIYDYEGTKFYIMLRNWCGASMSANYMRFRLNNNTSSYNTDGQDYLGLQVKNGGGMGWRFQAPSGKRGVYFIAPEDTPNGQRQSYVLDAGLSSPHQTPLLAPGQYYFQLFD